MTEEIKTLDDETEHGGIDPRSYLGYVWDVVSSSVGKAWLKEFAEIRDEDWVDFRCDSCGDIVHMGHDEPDGVWIRVNEHAICSTCILGLVDDGEEVDDD
ncbi:hypothetical protein EL22_16940 [Halostagnicola sp. A56]|uniref:hypothetical protein n=1 Tax=Halostagnicola sp. A56 TaxID=1495067 RepID=UPI00049FBDC0|nr:hypothetical protein [Halostagnicola sp. A56]KDE59813.1 hypothetical protein EL22_16940 [Halostagnicola sp. A56]